MSEVHHSMCDRDAPGLFLKSCLPYDIFIYKGYSVNEVSKIPVPRLKSCNSIKSSALESSDYSLK